MRIPVKWYFNELLGYRIMSFMSVPVITNDENKPLCIFSSMEMFYVETTTKRKQNDSIFKLYDFGLNIFISKKFYVQHIL